MTTALRLPALALALTVALAGPAGAQAPERLFYYVDRASSWESLEANAGSIDVVAPAAYYVDEDGVVYGDVDARVLELAGREGIGVWPLVVNRGFDQEELHRILTDEGASARVIRDMAGLCRDRGYDGLQVDFENLAVQDRDAFTEFYRRAAEALRREGCGISVAVVHRYEDFAGPTAYHEWLFDSWRGGYDLEALGRIGDFISIMSYSQHTRRTPPGPQAGIPWVEDIVGYFLAHVPAERLSMGIPLGSQHWYTSYEERITPELARSYSEGLAYPEAVRLASRHGAEILWMEEHGVPYAWFSVGGTFEWIFFEDARSFREKLEIVRENGLRGFSAWVLGSEDPGIWEELRR